MVFDSRDNIVNNTNNCFFWPYTNSKISRKIHGLNLYAALPDSEREETPSAEESHLARHSPINQPRKRTTSLYFLELHSLTGLLHEASQSRTFLSGAKMMNNCSTYSFESHLQHDRYSPHRSRLDLADASYCQRAYNSSLPPSTT